jgi:hypothetical protein
LFELLVGFVELFGATLRDLLKLFSEAADPIRVVFLDQRLIRGFGLGEGAIRFNTESPAGGVNRGGIVP